MQRNPRTDSALATVDSPVPGAPITTIGPLSGRRRASRGASRRIAPTFARIGRTEYELLDAIPGRCSMMGLFLIRTERWSNCRLIHRSIGP